jgi:hypothetical protein
LSTSTSGIPNGMEIMSRDLGPVKLNIPCPPGLFADYTIPLDVVGTMRTTGEPGR